MTGKLVHLLPVIVHGFLNLTSPGRIESNFFLSFLSFMGSLFADRMAWTVSNFHKYMLYSVSVTREDENLDCPIIGQGKHFPQVEKDLEVMIDIPLQRESERGLSDCGEKVGYGVRLMIKLSHVNLVF